MELFRSLYHSCLDVLFPPFCGGCRDHLDCGQSLLLCRACKEAITRCCSPICSCCGIPLAEGSAEDHLCGDCLQARPLYMGARAFALYSPPITTLLHKLKYKGDTSSQKILSELLKSADLHFFMDCDCVLPVPLHPKRLRARGLNQALILARMFFAEKELPVETGWLVRCHQTRPQTGLSRRQRRNNLRNSFVVKEQSYLRDKKVCLVDDVFTTGSTVEECTRTLLKAGVAGVKVLTLARVKRKPVLLKEERGLSNNRE